MYSSPYAKQHGDDTGTQEVESTTSRRTGIPTDFISTITEDQETHVHLGRDLVRSNRSVTQ